MLPSLRRPALLAAALAILNAPAFATTPFVLESVDIAGRTGYQSSLALDAQGDPHIAYYDLSNHDLRYARRSGASWITETVDATGIVGVEPSLSVDTFGNVSIAYYDSTGLDLKYAKKSRGLWTIEVVASAGNVGLGASLALDANGAPAISYHDATNGDLKYASKATGVWVTETVFSTGIVGRYSSLAFDPFGNPKIAYDDNSNTDLLFAEKNSGTWSSTWVADVSSSSYPNHPSLVLDGKGNPHIAYVQYYLGAYLIYGFRENGTWTFENPLGAVGFLPSLVLDSGEAAHIACMNPNSGSLHYLSKVASSWVDEEIVSGAGAVAALSGQSLRLDSQGNPHISYLDPLAEDLKYADEAIRLISPIGGERWPSGSTQTVRWAGYGNVNVEISTNGGLTYSSVAYGISGGSAPITVPAVSTEEARVKITRYDPYSTSESRGYFSIGPGLVSPWWSRTVDASGSVGSFASIKLDTHGSPRIAYWDGGLGDLKFASRSGAIWATEIVDASGFVGYCGTLALDSQGIPSISYIDGSLGNVKYARKAGMTWSLETAATTVYTDGYTSLALDAQGNPSISYVGAIPQALRFARKSGGVWSNETVDAGAEVSFASLALDGQGNPSVAYEDDATSTLKFARKSAGVWTIESVPGAIALYPSLALDAQGNAYVSFYDPVTTDLRYAQRIEGRWYLESVDTFGNVGAYTSLALDGQGNPHIAYYDVTNQDLKVATRVGGVWFREAVDTGGNVGGYASLALDAQGNPRLAYYDTSNADLKYASAAVELIEPAAGANWPVGARRTVRWDGTGDVDLWLSTDGGSTWSLRDFGLSGGEYRFTVPHTPSKFCKVRVTRGVPVSYAENDSLFTIQTSVSLLAMLAAPAPDGAKGAVVTWQTDPGPEDLSGYRLERASSAANGGGGVGVTLVALTRETSYTDPSAAPGSIYRLFAVNGLGEEVLVGETSFAPRAPLAAWPLPYRGGALSIAYAAGAGFGGAPASAEVSLFDVHGRLVRTIARGPRPAGYHAAAWDGRDDHGSKVAAGVYLLRVRSAGEERSIKVAVMR